MSYFNKCPDCGCNLDPGEVCECRLGNTEMAEQNNTEQIAKEAEVA